MSMPPANPYGSPLTATKESAYPGGQRRSKKTLKRIEPLSLALLQGGLFALLGLIPAVLFMGMAIVGTVSGGIRGSGSSIGVGLVGGLLIAVLAPLMYGVMGFVGGFVLALIYNACASFMGGIEMEFEE